MGAGPSDFPFDEGQHVAAWVTGSDGAAWFVGVLGPRGSGGVQLSSPPEVTGYDEAVTLWLPWDHALIRSVPDIEWERLLGTRLADR